MKSQVVDIAIIGGGIMGLLTAYELSSSGLKISVFEEHACGGEASWAGGGIVSPLYPWRYCDAVSALAKCSQNFYEPLCSALLDSTKIDPEWLCSGLLIQDIEDIDDALTWVKKHTVEVQQLGAADVGALQSGLTFLDNTLYFPQVAQVRNPRLLKALIRTVKTLGVDVFEHHGVQSLKMDARQCWKITTANLTNVFAKQIIVCAGAWTQSLFTNLGSSPKISPIQGQMIMYAPFEHRLKRIVLSNGKYLIPRRDGRILCGSTVEDVGFNKHTTTQALTELQLSAERIMPSLRNQLIERHWAGLRPATQHGVPYIGAVPNHEGLWVNAGHFRNGVVLAPASCKLIRNLVLNELPIVDPAPYGFLRESL